MSHLFASGSQSVSISPSNECSGLISFRMDSFDLLEVPGTLQSLLQHHSSKESYTFNKKHEITSPPVLYFTEGHSLFFAQDKLGEQVIPVQLRAWALRSNLSCTAWDQVTWVSYLTVLCFGFLICKIWR